MDLLFFFGWFYRETTDVSHGIVTCWFVSKGNHLCVKWIFLLFGGLQGRFAGETRKEMSGGSNLKQTHPNLCQTGFGPTWIWVFLLAAPPKKKKEITKKQKTKKTKRTNTTHTLWIPRQKLHSKVTVERPQLTAWDRVPQFQFSG